MILEAEVRMSILTEVQLILLKDRILRSGIAKLLVVDSNLRHHRCCRDTIAADVC
jgi:hypothetical protein